MSLPVVQYPLFDVAIPSIKKTHKFRPFTVKEQKLLYQSNIIDSSSVLDLVIQIIKSCSIDNFDVDSLKMFDIDYIFLALRARSVNELIPVNYVCRNKVSEDKECGVITKLHLNINLVEVIYPENYIDKLIVKISDTIGMKLFYPTVKQLRSGSPERKGDGVFVISDSFVFNCIECIYDSDSVMIPNKDFTEEDLSVFLETLPIQVIGDINRFFNQLSPRVTLKHMVRCTSCGHEEEVQITDFDGFFG